MLADRRSKPTVIVLTNKFPFEEVADSFFNAEVERLSRDFHLKFLPTARSSVRESGPRVRRYREQTWMFDQISFSWSLNRFRWLGHLFKNVGVDLLLGEYRSMRSKKSIRALGAVLYWGLRTPESSLQIKPHYVYSFWGTNIGYLARLLASFHGVTCFVRFHNFDLYEDRNKGRVPFNRVLFKDPNCVVIFLGPSALKYAESVGEVKSSAVIPLLVEQPVSRLARLHPAKDVSVVTISSDADFKRLDRVEETLFFLNQKTGRDIHWSHIGDLKMSAGWFNSSEVRYGTREHLGVLTHSEIETLLSHDPPLFVLFTSDHEGIPYSMLQAMAHGVPAFATDVGSIADVKFSSLCWLLSREASNEAYADQIAAEISRLSSLKVRRQLQEAILDQFGPHCTSERLKTLFLNTKPRRDAPRQNRENQTLP